jgi:hypothetical protein
MTHSHSAALLLLFAFAAAVAIAEERCDEIAETANKIGVRIPGTSAPHRVTGQGRLQFFSAPSPGCIIKGVFILPGEEVIAYTEYQGFTAVMYSNPRTHLDTEGWVATARLQATGYGIAPD